MFKSFSIGLAMHEVNTIGLQLDGSCLFFRHPLKIGETTEQPQ